MDERFASDEEIIELLFQRNERGLDLLSDKYSRFYTSILRNTLESEDDISECANDLLLSVWYSIPPNRPERLPAYVAKLARRIGINRFRHNTRRKRNEGCTVILSELESSIGVLPEADSDGDDQALAAILSGFIRTLDEETRILFVRRYVYFESVSSLAERFGMSENTVSVRLYRTRKKLLKFLRKEGIDI